MAYAAVPHDAFSYHIDSQSYDSGILRPNRPISLDFRKMLFGISSLFSINIACGSTSLSINSRISCFNKEVSSENSKFKTPLPSLWIIPYLGAFHSMKHAFFTGHSPHYFPIQTVKEKPYSLCFKPSLILH